MSAPGWEQACGGSETLRPPAEVLAEACRQRGEHAKLPGHGAGGAHLPSEQSRPGSLRSLGPLALRPELLWPALRRWPRLMDEAV
jgi:hypothetical protein